MGRSLLDPRYRALVARLIEKRHETGLTQRDVADRLGRTRSYVSKVETGELRVDFVQLLDWIEALGLSNEQTLIELAAIVANPERV